MSYLHCHSCRWEQDDFWDINGYTPLREDYIQWLRECLFKDFVQTTDYETEMNITLPGKEHVARELEKVARIVRRHKWTTFDNWKRDKNTAVCPKCGQRNWDID